MSPVHVLPQGFNSFLEFMHGALQVVGSGPMATLGKTSEFLHQVPGTLRISRLFGFADLPEQLLHPTDPFEFMG